MQKYHYRDHRDVLASILENLYNDGSGAGISYLIYNTNISWYSILSHLDELTQKEMIRSEIMPGTRVKRRWKQRVFFITPKGIRFLELYKKLKEFLK